MSQSSGEGSGQKKPGDSAGGPYLLRAVAVGLQLGTESGKQTADGSGPKARRPSLTQRLGFGAGKDKGKEAEDEGTGEDEEGADSSPPAAAPKQKQRARAEAKVECVEVVGRDMYVGTSSGRVMHYALAAPLALDADAPAPSSVLVADVDLRMGGKRVEQLVAFPGVARLAVLCGAAVLLLSLPDLRAVPGWASITGVTCMAFDERMARRSSPTAILCVARMRSIQLFRLAGSELRLEHEVPTASSVAAISQYGQHLCLADADTYKIVDLARPRGSPALELLPTQQPRTDPETGRVVRPPRPRTLVVGADEFMFLTESDDATLGVIVSALGEATRGTLQFAAYPKSIAYEEPYVIAVFANSVDLYDTRAPEQTLAQRFAFSGGLAAALADERHRPRRLCAVAGFLASTRVSLADGDEDGEPTAGALSRFVRGGVVLAAPGGVYALAVEPRLMVIERLINARRIDDAMAAVDAAGDGAEAAYCVQLAGLRCFGDMLLDDALQLLRRGALDPRVLLHLYPDYAEFLGRLLAPLDRLGVARGLREMVLEIGSVPLLVARSVAEMAGDGGDDGGDDAQQAGQREALAAMLAANADEVLERYLEHSRSHSDADVRAAVDTALARLYAAGAQHAKLRALLGDKHCVDCGLAAEFCRETGRHYYGSLLLQALGDARGVLAVWRRLLAGECHDARFGGMPEYLAYAEQLAAQDMLRGECEWLAGIDAAAALRILARLDDASVAALDADRVVAALQQSQSGGDQMLRLLIERLISAAHPRAPHYLTHLLTVYVRQLAAWGAAAAGRRARALMAERFRRAQAESLRLTFRAFLKEAADEATDEATDEDAREGAGQRARLVDLLAQTPITYDAAAVLRCVEDEAPWLVAERAVLLAALERPHEAAELLVSSSRLADSNGDCCQDFAEAESLLLGPRLARSAAGPSLLPFSDRVRRLLDLYLSEVAPADDEMAARLVADLLSRYADRLGDVGTGALVAAMPAHWPYAVAEPLVRRQLERLAQRERAAAVECGLRQSLALSSQLQCIDGQRAGGAIVLGYEQACAKCHKLLGSSAFVYTPGSREIRHVSCA
ncbi:hypothetical protein GGI04_001054 [Coemansia thaxteri]|nr:hypothetical protein GGI04_001054 [Coemansia thaxteri]KAJ2472789.1 hypothetical protein GGI02_001347 [Coemansia sp. RSA 2322]